MVSNVTAEYLIMKLDYVSKWFWAKVGKALDKIYFAIKFKFTMVYLLEGNLEVGAQ